jgi:hypothetical protein
LLKRRQIKEKTAFLLVWDKKQLYREISRAVSTHMFINTHIGSFLWDLFLLPGLLPIVASDSLRLFCLILYSKHINHIQGLGFLSFPFSSSVHFPLSMWPMSNNVCFRSNVCKWRRSCDFWPSEPD